MDHVQISGLRFINKDGKKILQFSTPLADWADVPLVDIDSPNNESNGN